MSSSFDFCSEHIWRILNKTEVVRVGEYCEGYPRPHSVQTKFPRLSLVNILLPAFSLVPDHPSPSLLWVSCGNADWEKLQILGLKFLTVLKFSRPRRQPFKFHTNYLLRVQFLHKKFTISTETFRYLNQNQKKSLVLKSSDIVYVLFYELKV